MKNRIILMIMGVALVALPAMAEVFDSQSSFANDYNRASSTMPTMAFKSTSSMSGIGSSYSANPTLNSDGTASYYGASAETGSKRPYKAPPINPRSGDQRYPLGDAVLPLMLMALGYMVWKRRRREERKEGYHPSKEYRQMPE